MPMLKEISIQQQPSRTNIPAGCHSQQGAPFFRSFIAKGWATTHVGAPPSSRSSQLRWAGAAQALLSAAMLLSPLQAQQSPTSKTPPATYLLHPGDAITVNYRFTPEFDDTATVAPDGRIALKNLGELPAAGLSLTALRQSIAIAAKGKLVDPEITVSLKEFERPLVVVAGEVQLPGKFELRKPTTALQAILLAGGPKQDSALGHVLLFRRISADTAETHVLDLHKLKSATARARNDMLLEPDDMILVRQDTLSSVERYVKIFNLGVYFNPIGNNGIF